MWCVVWVRDLNIYFFPRRLPVDSSWLHPARPSSPLICTLPFHMLTLPVCGSTYAFSLTCSQTCQGKHSLTISLLKNISLPLCYSHFCVSFRNNLSSIKQLSWDFIGIAEKCNINLKRNFVMIPSPYYHCVCQEAPPLVSCIFLFIFTLYFYRLWYNW